MIKNHQNSRTHEQNSFITHIHLCCLLILHDKHDDSLPNRKVSPGLMPPGSSGIFRRRKSSTYEAAHSIGILPLLTQSHRKMSDSPSDASQEIPSPNTATPWPNSKDDYELREIIGEFFIGCSCCNEKEFIYFVQYRRCWGYCRCPQCYLQTQTRKMCNQTNQLGKMEYQYGRITGRLRILISVASECANTLSL